MAAMYRLKGFGWLASCAIVAIGFYLVSSQVAAERKRLEDVNAKISSADRDIRALETEFDVRANLVQLERWNGDTLSLTVPTAAQFVRNDAALASISFDRAAPSAPSAPGVASGVQTAQLIVPSVPSFAPPTMIDETPAAPAAPAHLVTVAAQTTAAAPDRAITRSTAAPVARVMTIAAKGESAHAVRTVAMLDRNLLSDRTLGDLFNGASAERNRLR